MSRKLSQAKEKVYDSLSKAGEGISYGAQVTGEKLNEFKNYSVEKASDLTARAKAKLASTTNNKSVSEPSAATVVVDSNLQAQQKPTTEEKIGSVKGKIAEFEDKVVDQEALKVDESALGKRKFEINDEPEFLLSSKQTRTD